MVDKLRIEGEGVERPLSWKDGGTGKVKDCPKVGKNTAASMCLNCCCYGGFFDGQLRAVSVPQVAIGAGRVRRAVVVVCNTTTEAIEAAAEAKKTRKERDLASQKETAKKKGPNVGNEDSDQNVI